MGAVTDDNCPKCGVPYAIVGRVHTCVPVVSNANLQMAGISAGDQAVGAYQPAMCETPPATDCASDPIITANRGEPGSIDTVCVLHPQMEADIRAVNGQPIKRRRKPDTRKRKRAAYMRGYRASRKQSQQEATQ